MFMIAFVRTNQEISFRDWLALQDIEAYLPLTRSQTKQRNNKVRILVRAAFPHYVFVRGRINEIMRYAPGFSGYLHLAEECCMLEDEDIEQLKLREANGEFDRLDISPSIKYKAGTKVSIAFGAFAGMRGTIRRGPKSKGLVKVEIEGKIINVPIVMLSVLP